MRALSAKGILLGGLADIVATNIVTFPVIVVVATRANVAQLAKADRAPALLAAMNASAGLQVSTFMLGALCSILGGYVAARLAKRDEVVNGALSAYLCVGLGIYSLVAGHVTIPLWQHLVAFVASPALGALGGYLRLRQASRPEGPTLASTAFA